MITPPAVFSNRWHWPQLLLGHLLAALLLISYILPPGHALWQVLGSQEFFLLNGTLADNGVWTWFWAWMNTREVDAADGLFMLAFLLFPLTAERHRLPSLFCGFLTLMLLMLPARKLLSELSITWGLSGPSPSLTLHPVWLLETLRPDIPAKDSAPTSFPGDHASVLLIWFGLLAWNARGSLERLLLGCITLLLILPRLIGGAHWLADVAVGGTVMALVTLSWAFASPLAHWINQGVQKAITPLFKLCARIPLLRRLPLLSEQH